MKKVKLIATGGTIAMLKDPGGKTVPAVTGHDLLESIPELQKDASWDVVEFSNVASCNFDPERMLQLAKVVNESFADPDCKGIIITHGTDTLEETAYFLDLTVKDTRPVILTASQRDASERDSDGPRNLHNSLRIALDSRAKERGVLIALNEEIHAARDVRKLHTSHVDAFSSGELGSLGSIDNEDVLWHRKPEPSVKFDLPPSLAKVIICKAFTGMNDRLLDCMVDSQVEGVVIEAFGRGNLPPEVVPALKRITARNIPTVVTSRCLFGRTAPIYGYPGGGANLQEHGALFAGDLSTEKVRLLLSIALRSGITLDHLREILSSGGVK
ncbi:L-asparaginase/GlutRNAGln amidotransferase subunit D [Desulfitobacterium dichloroeliminans LMG P-21439]|uniref:asparaginase n=1 Tax=Desulfitobacterium dichloroeliminans (strain LMG P-21439 / DCA1) TaxID=871963 RepID=L0F9H8_DESDL|nr:asparaginase [Desulfitobacterium dichloroeliminans]AGA69583.1 L-asparaginase/GlutRNAGln amidotransferase subunit D [Desulfitobacterium dichloroeliminans LMG P-21439]